MFKCRWMIIPLILLFVQPIFSQPCLKGKEVKTRDVKISTVRKGVHIHTAIYSDGMMIVTVMDGNDRGKQVVTVNGKEIGVSHDISFRTGYFRHKHAWGEVLSYPFKQVVKFK